MKSEKEILDEIKMLTNVKEAFVNERIRAAIQDVIDLLLWVLEN